MESIDYWKKRYAKRSSDDVCSGKGSRGKFLDHKVSFLNKFIKQNNIKSILDFGYGDSVVASKLCVETYVGIDIESKLENNKNKYCAKNVYLITSKFDEFISEDKFDLVMSLDVIYHIDGGNEIGYKLRSIDKMYNFSNHFIIYYDIGTDEWKKHLENNYNVNLIYEQSEGIDGTTARFFVYEKMEINE